MKKFILALILCFTTSLAFSQVYTYKSYSYCQKRSGQAWTKPESSNLTITINLDTDVIKINNRLGSTFYVYDCKSGVDDDGESYVKCWAYDEEGLKCTVRLVQRKNGKSQIYVDYNNIVWCYDVRRINYLNNAVYSL